MCRKSCCLFLSYFILMCLFETQGPNGDALRSADRVFGFPIVIGGGARRPQTSPQLASDRRAIRSVRSRAPHSFFPYVPLYSSPRTRQMYHSVQRPFCPPGYANNCHHFGCWRLPYGHNNNNNMASTASGSPCEGPPPLIPISRPAEDSQDDDPASSPPSLLEKSGPANLLTNMSSFVNQHAYAAVWQAQSIARYTGGPGVPAQGPLQQGWSPAGADRTQATAEPSRANVQYIQTGPNYPARYQNFNGYGNYINNINNYNNLQNHYQQVRQADIQRQTAPHTYHPASTDSSQNYFGNAAQNSHRYQRANSSSNDAFFQQQSVAMHQQLQQHQRHLLPPVSAQLNQMQATAHPLSTLRNLSQPPAAPSASGREKSVVRKRKGSCPETSGATSSPVLANTASEQTTLSAMGATQSVQSVPDAPHRNRVNNPVPAQTEPAAKARKVSAPTSDHQNKPVAPDPSTSKVVALNKPNDKDGRGESPKLRRYRYLLENPLLIQDLILEEKQRLKSHGSNHLDIDLDVKPGHVLYQTIDFVRFHRIVASGKVVVRLSETDVGPVVLVVHPSVASRFDAFTTHLKESSVLKLPLVEKLLKPLHSTECFKDYALLAHREPFCWELAGFLGPLEGRDNEVLPVESAGCLQREPVRFITFLLIKSNIFVFSQGADGQLERGH